MAAIYKITNILTNSSYIGQTIKEPIKRYNEHLRCVNYNKYKNILLYKNIRKYGKENFKFEVLVQGDFNKNLLNDLEIHYIKLYNTYIETNKKGLNLSSGGNSSSGYKLSQKTKDKISAANKGKFVSLETRIKRSSSLKGRIITDSQRKKISKTLMGHSYNKGIKKTKEHKLKLKEANLNLLKNGYRLPFKKYLYQYDLNNNFIKRFDSVKEAMEELKLSKTAIKNISQNITKNPKCGFRFIITKEVLNEQ